MAGDIIMTECPRDAMQGLHRFIPTELKAEYINLLLQVGFDIIDFGSFVSAKAIPQLQDTAAVLQKLDLNSSRSKLLAIVANHRGAQEAAEYPEIGYLGYPFSISETFQKRNTNAGMSASFGTVEDIRDLCAQQNKVLRIYLSMSFGNPYGDDWDIELLLHWIDRMHAAGINDIYIADTIGIATPEQITLVQQALNHISGKSFGMHLHSTPDSWQPKIDAAYNTGCRKFDTALKGFGGCPMAADELTGNIATENLISYLQSKNEAPTLNLDKLKEAMEFSVRIFD